MSRFGMRFVFWIPANVGFGCQPAVNRYMAYGVKVVVKREKERRWPPYLISERRSDCCRIQRRTGPGQRGLEKDNTSDLTILDSSKWRPKVAQETCRIRLNGGHLRGIPQKF